MSEASKTVIIGLDGVPFGMLEGFAKTGVMPNVAKIISGGIFKPMHSSIPEISSVAWSSMITGANPGEHGIFGFMDLRPDSYQMRFPNYNDIRVDSFWEKWPGKSVIINVPSTYPVRGMNGVHISGFVSLDFAKSVHPKSLVPKLQDMGYMLDVDSMKAHSDMDGFLRDLDDSLKARIEAAEYLWENEEFDTFMLVFTATDRLMHFLWDAYADSDHKYHDFFLDHFRKIDGAIGKIADRLGDDDLLVMVSDHGFEGLDYDVYVNYYLAEEGFLSFKDGTDPAINNICFGTKAFALDPGRIYLNCKGKYPCGTVEDDEAESILADLKERFGKLEIDGRKVIRDIYTKEEIYTGPFADNAADLVLVGAEGFNLKANLRTTKLADKGVFTGKHTQDTAFLAIKGKCDESVVPDVPCVSDVKGIIERAKGM